MSRIWTYWQDKEKLPGLRGPGRTQSLAALLVSKKSDAEMGHYIATETDQERSMILSRANSILPWTWMDGA